jgi:hypothetical protein
MNTDLLQYLETDGSDFLNLEKHWHLSQSKEEKNLEAWVWGLQMWGNKCLLQVALSAAKIILSLWDKQKLLKPNDEILISVAKKDITEPHKQIALIEDWLKNPSEEILLEAEETCINSPQMWFDEPEFKYLWKEVFVWSVMAGHNCIAIPNNEMDWLHSSRTVICAVKALECGSGELNKKLTEKVKSILVSELRATMLS